MLLLSIILLPLLAAVLLALLGSDRSIVRWIALLTAIGTLLLSLGIASRLNTIREGRVLIENNNVVNSPVQPKIEWRRTWLTIGEQSVAVAVAKSEDFGPDMPIFDANPMRETAK